MLVWCEWHKHPLSQVARDQVKPHRGGICSNSVDSQNTTAQHSQLEARLSPSILFLQGLQSALQHSNPVTCCRPSQGRLSSNLCSPSQLQRQQTLTWGCIASNRQALQTLLVHPLPILQTITGQWWTLTGYLQDAGLVLGDCLACKQIGVRLIRVGRLRPAARCTVFP